MSDDFRRLPDGTILHTPPNTLLRIDSIWVFVSVDKDGNEGVVAGPLAGMGLVPVPLIAADEARLKSLNPIAEQVAKKTGMKIRLIRLTTREVVREIEP